ncbi:unannotated protein [freshwater metagenome]|uniref:Unannotated protein n=1 Tax=freshwater metagenome TaxID=449393 RepID=A0A6J6IZP6_9ZZZZ|nr:Holliday junction resolvase RuvX [Actinomycetota bacterium]
MRKGKRLAVDVGTVRIGLAICDPEGILSSPLPTLARSSHVDKDAQSISELIAELSVIEVIVGDPIALSGEATKSTEDARMWAREIATSISVPLRLVDERLTTVSASSKLRESGKDSKSSKHLIDSASAVEILEQALNSERLSGLAPGRLVGDLDE